MNIRYLYIILLINASALAAQLPIIEYPFNKKRAILCDQGTQSPPENSHTHDNTLYALDLATPHYADLTA